MSEDLCEYEDDVQADLASGKICYICCSDVQSWIDRCVACKFYVTMTTCNDHHNSTEILHIWTAFNLKLSTDQYQWWLMVKNETDSLASVQNIMLYVQCVAKKHMQQQNLQYFIKDMTLHYKVLKKYLQV